MDIIQHLHKLSYSQKIFLDDQISKQKVTFKDFFTNSYKLSLYLKLEKNIKKDDIILFSVEQNRLFYELIFACLFLKCKIFPISKDLKRNEFKNLKKFIKPNLEIFSTDSIFYHTRDNFNLPEVISKIDINYNFLLLPSSGTTSSNIKVIQHTFKNLFLNGWNFLNLSKFKSSDIFFAFWPQTYMAGIFNLFIVPLISKSKIVLYDEIKLSNLKEIILSLKKFKISKLYLTPTMIMMMIRYKNILFKNYKFEKKIQIISTSSFLYSDIKKSFFKIYKKNIINCYGITELAGSFSLETKKNYKFGSVGKLIKEIKIKCNGTVNQPKEIFFKTKNITSGYFGRKKFKKNIYFNSGDIGYVKSRELFIKGRVSDLVKKGGIFVSLTKIEELALSIDKVFLASAICSNDKFYGVKINLYVQLTNENTNSSIVKNELLWIFNQNLMKIESPDEIYFVKKLKTTKIGKVKKFLYK